MTRWILLALVACASAQNVDRHEEATRYLEKAAKANNSPVLSALALKMATATEGSALTKVIKFIDEAYNNIQKQIEKETAENARCEQQTAQSDAVLNKLAREIMQTEADVSSADENQADAASMVQQHRDTKEQLQNDRTKAYNDHVAETEAYNKDDDQLKQNRDALSGIATSMKTTMDTYKDGDEDKKKALADARNIFLTMETRVSEHIEKAAQEHNQLVQEYTTYTQEDDRQMKATDARIKKQKTRQGTEATKARDSRKMLTQKNRSQAQAKELRKALDEECVKTTVNHEDRAAQRQAEIDSLKQVKEILEGV